MFGKILINKQAIIFKNVNTIIIDEIGRLNSGTFNVQIMMNN
ncbi:MAG TPA: hypothetical protein PKG56_02765 [Chitinophagaceae bacterium]|nr:hypothetical protein [Chitinophagaceae bacterium]HNE93512.1 hypothetical protein [Chitinophagaceae bacterium]HNF30066.1 hypothetical protein [Chitinophagaceae bacterium]HNJ58534.1 hypothetical protein [Chitinophagaceae bacterium]HNL82289.1 hypothetical protein [Chitinophagaceae bacterium]